MLPVDLRITTNSDIPYSANDGAMWAGRGFNLSVTPVASGTYDSDGFRIRGTFAPTLTLSQNRPFQFLPGTSSARSTFASPWHTGAASADLPLRFGNAAIRTVDLGQSTIEVVTPGWAFGATTRNEWWGPGIRNTLVMSNNAPGIPRLFARTNNGLRSAAGTFDGRIVVGTLTESPFFDTLTTDDYRSLSGVLITFRPAVDTNLTLGFSRVVYAPVSTALGTLSHSFDVFTRWTPIGSKSQKSDQIASLFGRWVLPGEGFEVYGEVARMELPRSIREALSTPQHTAAYLLGLQIVRETSGRGRYVRVQTELLNLEQSIVFPDRSTPDFYTGTISAQGYTQRGQMIGAATGPGSSSQWLAGDFVAPSWQAGLFVGRTRWENDAMFQLTEPRVTRHDVTILSGARGAVRTKWSDALAELTVARRFNYLFQNDNYGLGEVPLRAIDVQNVTFSLRITPPSPR